VPAVFCIHLRVVTKGKLPKPPSAVLKDTWHTVAKRESSCICMISTYSSIHSRITFLTYILIQFIIQLRMLCYVRAYPSSPLPTFLYFLKPEHVHVLSTVAPFCTLEKPSLVSHPNARPQHRRPIAILLDRAIAQAVSRLLPTAAARVRAQVRSCGICGR
jgi:hypothetical protein